MKEVEADRLLDLHGAALCAFFSDIPDPDIAAAPEIVHVLLLGRKQLLKPLGRHAIHRPLGTAAKFLGRSRPRRVIDHVLGEVDRTVGQGVDCEGDLAGVLGVGNLVGVPARGLQCMVNCAGQDQTALFGRMAENDPAVFGIAGSVMEHPASSDADRSHP